eukprot:Blabericola_migrator_1__1675@NODE_144_length_13005_cov_119_784279_g125_i0_p2_GENE_NODE_144_length_13005_cov_119_784279_g125_i0NODE_144_length_13005_cov_119_784279_g125_i0_p2_ORF_typecomplete_len786_score143_30DUF21/PF01595_20/0_48DUF21/PF01595_20/5_5e02_NODE_144_length_13005_cov_119_784279_g125_i029725329
MSDNPAASTLLKYIKDNPPPPARRTAAPVSERPPPTLQRWKFSTASEVTYEVYKQHVLLGSLKLKSSFLFRALGSSIAVSSRFGFSTCIIVPVIGKVLGRILGVKFPYLEYLLYSLATASQLALIPLASVSLLTHAKQYETSTQKLRRLARKPLAQLAALLYARTFVSFLFMLTSLCGLRPSLADILAAAVVGVTVLSYELHHDNFLVDWDELLSRKRPLRSTFTLRNLMISIAVVVHTVSILAWLFGTSETIAALRFATLLLLAPYPAIGFPVSVERSATHYLTRLFSCVAYVWLAEWMIALTKSFQEARMSVLVASHKDLLLAANGRSWMEQFAFMSHILSPLDDVSDSLPLTSAIAFIPHEDAYSSRYTDTPHTSHGPHVCLVPSVPTLCVPVYSNSPPTAKWTATRRSNINTTFDVKSVQLWPANAVSFVLGPIIHKLCGLEVISAMSVMAAQNCHRSFIAKSFCMAVCPSMFGTSPIWDLSESQLKTRSGFKRKGFYSDEKGSRILSYEAGTLIFGDQIHAALMSRTASIAKALQVFLMCTETLMTTPPSGIVRTMDNPTGDAGSIPRVKSTRSCLYRFENDFLIDLESGTNLLVGSNTENPIYKYLDSNKWKKFGDGSIGIEPKDRDVLLRGCEECLYAILGLYRMSIRGLRNIMKIRQHFYAAMPELNAPNQSSIHALTGTKFQKHYPFWLNNDIVKKTESSMTMSQSIVAHSIPLNKMLQQFAELPQDPPLCQPDTQLQQMCLNILDDLTDCLSAIDPTHTSQPTIFCSHKRQKKKC